MTNEQVALMLDEFAAIHGALGDRFRRLAYERAAATIRSTGARLTGATPPADLDALPNVGESVAAKISEFLKTGAVKELTELKQAGFPRDFARFTSINGVGPKTALRLYREIGVDTLDDLEKALASGKARQVLSERVARRVAEELSKVKHGPAPRITLSRAEREAAPIADAMSRLPWVEDFVVAGSIRRCKPTVGDLDMLAATRESERVTDAFVSLPQIRDVLSRGEHTRVVLRSGLEADLWVVDPSGWGAALSYATGSREHTLELRRAAVRRGWSIKTDHVLDERGHKLPVETEAQFYRTLGMHWMPPEIRENRGEIEAAEEGTLPELVTVAELKGDLHMHTRATDGTATLREMVDRAHELGREYVAITDHARGLAVPPGLDEDAFARRLDEVRGEEFPIPVLVGAEVNILEGGKLSLSHEALGKLDLVIASLHSGLREPREEITDRVVNAISTGLVDVLGHPTNRRLPRRPESDIDFDRVFEAAKAHDVAVEINASPERMDLPGRLVRQAKAAGLQFTIDTDAHHLRELENLPYGVAMALRGWLEAGDVLTARPFEEFKAWLDSRH